MEPKDSKAQEPNLIDANELVVAIKRGPEGLMILLRPQSRSELVMAFGELQLAMMSELIKVTDLLKQSHDRPNILNFARRFKK